MPVKPKARKSKAEAPDVGSHKTTGRAGRAAKPPRAKAPNTPLGGEPFGLAVGKPVRSSFSDKRTPGTLPLFVVQKGDYSGWLDSAPPHLAGWLRGTAFSPKAGAVTLLPGDEGPIAALVVVEHPTSPWDYAGLPRHLPQGSYEVEPDLVPAEAEALCLGWALGAYSYDRYKKQANQPRVLVWPAGARKEVVLPVAEGIYFARDLVNTPASDLGPEELADAAKRVAKRHGAKVKAVVGADLLTEGYPLVHAVGRASSRAPRFVEFTWGSPKNPRVALVGKGVCFDSGGLDIKPAQFMKLMKKDMGGAALVLGLAHAVMSLGLAIHLHVLVPAVENSVSGDAFRPLDVIRSRKGLTVEIGDTDAEGRLVLADALTRALEDAPALLIDAATLTGAARVALGTSLPAVFANETATWQELERASEAADDPLWRLPLFAPYRKKLESSVADLSNVGDSYAGAITAALFLREFVGGDTDWLHVDTMAYNLEPRPGRPVGGEAMGLLALLRFLEERFGRR